MKSTTSHISISEKFWQTLSKNREVLGYKNINFKWKIVLQPTSKSFLFATSVSVSYIYNPQKMGQSSIWTWSYFQKRKLLILKFFWKKGKFMNEMNIYQIKFILTDTKQTFWE